MQLSCFFLCIRCQYPPPPKKKLYRYAIVCIFISRPIYLQAAAESLFQALSRGILVTRLSTPRDGIFTNQQMQNGRGWTTISLPIQLVLTIHNFLNTK